MRPKTHPRRILIIDDDADDRTRLVRTLRTAFPAAEFQEISSKQDVDAAMESRFDVALTEYQLNGTNGLKILKKIRQRFPHLPVIWVSSVRRHETIVAGMKAGLNDYVSKKDLQRLPKAIRDSLAEVTIDHEGEPGFQTLKASAQHYRVISDLISDYAYLLCVEPGGTVICEWVNEGFTAITGYTLDAIAQQGNWTWFVHPEDIAIVSQRQQRWLAGQKDLSEFRIRTRTGEERWWRDYTCPVRDVNQSPVVRIYGAGQDITERRRLEEPLRQAQKMEAIGRLAGGIAHDFNNLLQVVSGYSDLLLRRLTRRSALQQYVQEIKNVAEQGAMLTRQLMMVGRRSLLQSQVQDFRSIISNITPILQRLVGDDIVLTTGIEPGIGHVTAEPGQLEQVILNLVMNARDAMPQGGRLSIEAANVRLDTPQVCRLGAIAPGEYLRLVVSDTGCGMDAETQTHIFEPFFTTKQPGKGTGLGLFTVYGIISQHGGNLQVESTIEVGTTFIIHLPRAQAPVKEVDVQAAPRLSPTSGETVLLVEDEVVVRDLMRQVLQSTGYTVLEATSGEQALQLSDAHQGRIHLLVADVVLPSLSGPEVAEHLALTRPDMQVIYMSGYAHDMISRHGVSNHQCRFLQKPFTPTVLLAHVREALDTSKG